jgi:hypothetical protein
LNLKAAIAIAILSATTSCGGGGGGGSTPGNDGSGGTGSGGNGTSTELSYGSFAPIWGPLGSTINAININGASDIAYFDVYTQDPVNDSNLVYPALAANEMISNKWYAGSTSPVPPLKGTTFSYFQFSVAPNAIVPANAQGYFLISAQYQVLITDPFDLPTGRFVDCALYAGSTLVGSGSNLYIQNSVNVLDGTEVGPGFLCNTAVHGNSLSSAPAFRVNSLQSGITYTFVLSLE